MAKGKKHSAAQQKAGSDSSSIDKLTDAVAALTFSPWATTLLLSVLMAFSAVAAYQFVTAPPPAQTRATLPERTLTQPEAAALCKHRKFIIRESSIAEAGEGVFTAAAIAKGELVGFYEGDDFTQEQVYDPEYTAMFQSSPYVLENPHGGLRMGLSPPKEASCGVAQMMNDAAPSALKALPRNLTLKQLNTALASYQRESLARNNVACAATTYRGNGQGASVVDENNPYLFFATRDLKPGEELFHKYGATYWVSAMLRQERGMRKLALFMALSILSDGHPSMGVTLTQGDVTWSVVYSQSARALVRVEIGGEEQSFPLGEEFAGPFLAGSLKMGSSGDGTISDEELAALWPDLLEDGGQPLPVGASAADKLDAAVKHLASGGAVFDAGDEDE